MPSGRSSTTEIWSRETLPLLVTLMSKLIGSPGHTSEALAVLLTEIFASHSMTLTGLLSLAVTLVPFGGLPVALTMLGSIPAADWLIWAISLIRVELLGPMESRVQLIFWPYCFPAGMLSRYFKPSGRASTTLTWSRDTLPVFVTLMSKLIGLPGHTSEALAVLLTEMLAQLRFTKTLLLLRLKHISFLPIVWNIISNGPGRSLSLMV